VCFFNSINRVDPNLEGVAWGWGLLFKIIAAWSFTKMGLLEPTAAVEAMALFHGVQFCKNLGLHSLIVEGDAQLVINLGFAFPKTETAAHMVIWWKTQKLVLRSFPRWQSAT
jgi:hypothetical protein